MKTFFIIITLISTTLTIDAQSTEKPKVDVVKKANDRVYQVKDRASTNVINKPAERIETAVDKGIDKALDKIGDDFKSIFKKKNKNPDSLNNKNAQIPASDSNVNTPKKGDSTNTKNTLTDNQGNTNISSTSDKTKNKATPTPIEVYARYDFIPGRAVIFEDDFHSEQLDEIPSKWIVQSGKIEMTNLNGQLVATCISTGSMVPRISAQDYLPQRFTIEYDYFISNPTDKAHPNLEQTISFCTDDASKDLGEFSDVGGLNDYQIKGCVRINCSGYCDFRTFNGTTKSHEYGVWRHVALSVNERSLKLYVDNERVINAPIQNAKAHSFRINSYAQPNEYQIFYRNFRIASGGGEPYQQLETEGKFVARGINFDYGKAIIRPESMGELNRIVALMKEHPELRFEIGGHTDNDGDDAINQKLSEQRAEAVRQQLITLDVDTNRLTSKGYGKSKPMTDNTTPEGKANNRRVEFVKQ